MRIISLLVVLTFIQLTSLAQKIDYTIPEGYEKDISREDYKKIVDLSVATVAKRFTIDFIKEGTIHVTSGQGAHALNLHNLISKCVAATNKSDWEKIIQGHFENLFASIDEQKKMDPTNFESMKKYLGIRIYPKTTVEERGGVASIIAREDLEGTYTLLMLDLPGAFTPVQKEMFILWKKDAAEVFSIAQKNINGQQVEKVTQTFDIDGSKIEISFIGDEDYAASYALDLMNNSPELVGEWGSAVAIPNKGLVDICKISKDKPVDFVKFIQRTKPMITKSYNEHPQPVSDQYYWYYKGKFTKINVTTSPDGHLSVLAPQGLTEMMTK